ncbi:uncharacterized protein NPIL_285041 [Nephila pilipes]|uniref:Vitellogenin n=1 Tax=Nephila pilipes TaxID=299642 RepID=A0A8X6NU68_NEPPI|nr:uncharacterized protein NPIL_285041 [Nephila pilipes]
MRLFAAAIALLVLGVANAIPENKLSYPEFEKQKTQVYDVSINYTTGVSAIHPQVSKSVIHLELYAYAKTLQKIILCMKNVKISGSIYSIDSPTDPITLKTDSELQKHLEVPIEAVFENGQVKSYTLADDETIESKKIKRTIMRNFQVPIPKEKLEATSGPMLPITFNVSRSSPVGNYSSHYIVTSSPYPYFPYIRNVYNISRTDNYETIPYLAYRSHHNFDEQGCPGVCRKDHVENPYGAGCPGEWEPYQTPMKKSFVQHHNFRILKTGITIIDIIKTKETHVADVYDQNMEVTIETRITFKNTTSEIIPDPINQKSYEGLNDWKIEIDEEEIKKQCKYPKPSEAIEAVQHLLQKITDIVYKRSIETEKVKKIGEYLVMLQKAMTILEKKDFVAIHNTITEFRKLQESEEKDKIKRQIWLDSLPLVGTESAVIFITELIRDNINKPEKSISLWEAKTFLEAIPMNILNPNAKIIQSLIDITEILPERTITGYTMYYAASYMAVARVIRNLCAVKDRIPDEETKNRNLNELFQEYRRDKCPKHIVKKFITDINEKLKTTTDRSKRVIYIEILSHTGMRSALQIIAPFPNRRLSGLTPSYNDFVRSVAIHALHNLVAKYPTEVRRIVLPVYVNKTEPPKLRIASFGVFIRSFPSLGELQLVAEESWKENSIEVGSYVTTTLEKFGNSSNPCDQLTARRIKKVLPQVKQYHVGRQHARNIFHSWFDEIRGFGLEHRFEMTPSNESYFPSTFYTALGYNADTLKDYFFRFALNAQGFTSRNLYDKFLEELKLKPAEDIPKAKIPEIFPEVNVLPRDPEFWRFTLFEKLFYITTYYYYDSEQHEDGTVIDLLKDHLQHYFKRDSTGTYSGHLVKVYMPSSYQTKAIGHALPYPVEFEMKNPLLISLKLEIKPTTDDKGIKFSFDVSPTVYYSTLYTNQILNVGDCKHVGVYHEKRVAATYPFKVVLGVEGDGIFHISYEFPELNKKVFTYSSEAGTYAGEQTLEMLPFMRKRSTIKTIPSQFVRKDKFHIPGFPVFESKILTENIQFGKERIPQTKFEIINSIVKNFLNAGWKRKSVDITRVPSSSHWNPNTKVVVHIDHHRKFEVTDKKPKTEEEWVKTLNLDAHDKSNCEIHGKTIFGRVVTLSHIKDEVDITFEYKLTESESTKAIIHVVHNHTLEGAFHAVRISTNFPEAKPVSEIHTYFASAFLRRPNEFKYGDGSFENQIAILVGSISKSQNPFEDPIVISETFGQYKSLESKLNKEVVPPAPKRSFLPESHEECLRDVKDGKPQSVHCLKAIRERAIYNKWNIYVIWGQPLCKEIIEVAKRLDIILKHSLFNHMTAYETQAPRELKIDITYIDKLTNEPLLDIVITKPNQVVKFERVYAGWMQPVSSIYSVADSHMKHWTNNTYPPSCSFMDKYVRTYDMKTYHAPVENGCSYILTTHCLERKKFAIIAKVTTPTIPGTKEIYIYIGKHTIVLTPLIKGNFVIKYDDKDHPVQIYQPIMFNFEEAIYAVSNVAADGRSYVEIHAEKAGIKVTYDGRNVKTEVDPRYKGELCGLCSEFNGEIYREMRGPSKCLYSNSGDFTKANKIGTCGDRKPKYPYICPSEGKHEWSERNHPHDREEEREPTLRRNKVLIEGDRICFSIEPLPVCEREQREVRTNSRSTRFHCLPKTDNLARKLVTEADERILHEMKNKTAHITIDVKYPVKCSS